MSRHLSTPELQAGLPAIENSPKDAGSLEMIVIRPRELERLVVEECELSFEFGAHGDAWASGCWRSLEDGSPDPDVQVTLMNSRCIALLSQDRSRWALAGDQLYVDLDLSEENLPVGTRVAVGTAVLEITSISHTGCAQFAGRYGPAATKFVNSRCGTAFAAARCLCARGSKRQGPDGGPGRQTRSHAPRGGRRAMTLLIGLDLGTTGCKAAVYDQTGCLLGESYLEYGLITVSATEIEQDPAAWWDLSRHAIKGAIAATGLDGRLVKGIAVSSQGISFVCVDGAGEPLGNAINWLDARAAAECDQILAKFDAAALFALTGKRASPAYTLPKLLWLRGRRPDTWAATRKILMGHDYLVYRLCGEAVTDHSMAGGTLLYDLRRARLVRRAAGRL